MIIKKHVNVLIWRFIQISNNKININLQISSDHPQHILLETHQYSRRIRAAQ